MNLIVYVNEHYEEERALVDLDTGKVLLQGDYYHDKISERITGYLHALRDFNLLTAFVETVYITRDHPHYRLMEFYDEEGLGE